MLYTSIGFCSEVSFMENSKYVTKEGVMTMVRSIFLGVVLAAVAAGTSVLRKHQKGEGRWSSREIWRPTP